MAKLTKSLLEGRDLIFSPRQVQQNRSIRFCIKLRGVAQRLRVRMRRNQALHHCVERHDADRVGSLVSFVLGSDHGYQGLSAWLFTWASRTRNRLS